MPGVLGGGWPGSGVPAEVSLVGGLRCVIVQVETMGIKGAFGVLRIKTLDTHRLDQGRRNYADPAGRVSRRP